MHLTPDQRSIIASPLSSKSFVYGRTGCGKTTVGVERLDYLLEQGISADSILVLTPQRTLQEPYKQRIAQLRKPGGECTFVTIGGLSRRMVDLFWPLAAEVAGFAHLDQPPTFLTLETGQYFMAHIVQPMLKEGYLDSVTIDRNRLYSQVIDNLNKAAAVGFDYREIGDRLTSAWFGDPSQRRVYDDAQECANRFRQYCLEHNLLDFSLQLETFFRVLWPSPFVRDYLFRTYRHLIYDNVEEDIPRAHDLIQECLPYLESALLIFDEEGGYRHFLGADPQTGWELRNDCNEQFSLQRSFVTSSPIAHLEKNLAATISPGSRSNKERKVAIGGELHILNSRYYPELLDSVADEINRLIAVDGLSPSSIVILAPYLSDALRFSITNRLDGFKIPWRSHRPSRSLRDEPDCHALLTLAALAHPAWNIHPPRFDVAYMLMQVIEGLDLVRAQLLTEIVYRSRDLSLAPFDGIKSDVQNRITFLVGNRYTLLRNWLLSYREGDPLPLDHFFRKSFGEILSVAGFGFHTRLDSVRVVSSLVESVYKFRQVTELAFNSEGIDPGLQYLAMLQEGVIAAQYLESWRMEQGEAVLVAPAHTFIMMNQHVTVQFWLDVGSSGWSERLYQPLTQPYVLSRQWKKGDIWTDANEVEKANQALQKLVSGLLLRCRERVYLGITDLGEGGFEQRGTLLRAFQKVLQQDRSSDHV